VCNDEDRRDMAVDSMVSGGCLISGSKISRSLLFSNVKVNSYCEIENAVVLTNVEIHRGSRIRRAVIDSDCSIPSGSVIGYDHKKDAERFYVAPGGAVLVTPEMLGQEVHYVR
jgi:glucose-1-phosphate adenylyltransferase